MSITLSVSDMTCEGCEDIVENAATEVAGVESATADRHESTLVVDGDADTADLIDAIDYGGYEAAVDESASEPESDPSADGESSADESGAEAPDEQPETEPEEPEADAEGDDASDDGDTEVTGESSETSDPDEEA